MPARWPARSPGRFVVVLSVVAAAVCGACSSSRERTSTSSTTIPSTTVLSTTVLSTTGVADAPAGPPPPVPGARPIKNTMPVTSGAVSPDPAPQEPNGPPVCEPPATTVPVAAVAVGDQMSGAVSRDWDITSFDDTVIRAHWFPLETLADGETAPTVLMGPGWGGGGDTDVDAVGLLGSVSISALRDAGYNVLTWDPRGFGASAGSVQFDSVHHEARDVQRLLDWLAIQPQVELDAPGDPRSGMVGDSYGGAIQLVTAAIDCRVDALVPIVAWHSLTSSLYKAATFKSGWANLLASAAMTADLDPTITAATEAGSATGVLAAADVDWLAARGPGALVADITAPTFIIQGTVDTLFTLDEGVTNFEMLRAAGVPAAMMWFCGGHGTCLSTASPDPASVSLPAIAWLDRYVKRDGSTGPAAAFEFVDQHGVHFSAEDFPSESEGSPVTASGSGTLELVAEGGSGPAGGGGEVASFSESITPTRAENAVDVRTAPAPSDGALVVGAPQLTLTYTGTTPEGVPPTRVFAQLIDDTTGLVLGNQVTPIEVVLDGASHRTTVPLEMVAHSMAPGSTLSLQIVATTVAYGAPRFGGTVQFSSVDLSLPVMTSAVPVPPSAVAGAG